MKPENVASKGKEFILEAIGSHQIDGTKLEVELNWVGTKRVVNTQIGFSRPVIKPFWHVKLSTNEFLEWWQTKNKVSIFFDGASKGNPGKAGAGGLIFYPGGKLETSFSWGVGHLTNNQVELFALLKACQLA